MAGSIAYPPLAIWQTRREIASVSAGAKTYVVTFRSHNVKVHGHGKRNSFNLSQSIELNGQPIKKTETYLSCERGNTGINRQEKKMWRSTAGFTFRFGLLGTGSQPAGRSLIGS
jgi:hypothetical protein